MAAHNDLGKYGEDRAVEYLKENGYTILETNWTFHRAEIDIIAQKEDVLAIVEVKTRSTTQLGMPQDFVRSKKVGLLVKAVNEYVLVNDIDVNVRFDIISVYKYDGEFITEHLEDAFYHF